VFGHPEFTQFNQTVTALFDRWKQAHLNDLLNIELESKPKALIEKLSESLLLTCIIHERVKRGKVQIKTD
jgi:type I restriction enzyme M protein